MAAKIDFSDYLHGEGNVESGLRNLLSKTAWTDSQPPYTIVVRFTPPSGSGYEKMALVKIAGKSTFEVGAIVAEIESQLIEKLGPSPMGQFHLLLSDAKGVLYQKMRQVAPVSDPQGNLSVDLLRGMLAEERMRVTQMQQLISGSFAAAVGAGANQAQSISSLATQRSVSSSAADAGGLSGIMGMIALVVGYPMLKSSLGLPPDATTEHTVKAVQLAVQRWSANESRGLASDVPVVAPPIPTGASNDEVEVEDSTAPRAITMAEPPSPIDDDVLLAQAKGDKVWRKGILKRLLADPEIQADATLAFLESQK